MDSNSRQTANDFANQRFGERIRLQKRNTSKVGFLARSVAWFTRIYHSSPGNWPKCKKSRILNKQPIGGTGGVSPLAEVRVQEGEPLENALRRFKRKVQQEDIIKEVKRHSYYLKPGEKRRVKEALARKRNRKKARKEQD